MTGTATLADTLSGFAGERMIVDLADQRTVMGTIYWVTDEIFLISDSGENGKTFCAIDKIVCFRKV